MKKPISTRKRLLKIYKSFIRPNLNYVDIIRDKPLRESLKKKIVMVQYNAPIIIDCTKGLPMKNHI